MKAPAGLIIVKHSILLIVILAIVIGVYFRGSYIEYLPILLATIYLLIIAPGAYWGGRELDRKKIEGEIGQRWNQHETIAHFIISNWYSIKYVMSSQARGENLSSTGTLVLLYGIWLFFSGVPWQILIWVTCTTVLLWYVGIKASMVFGILKYKHDTAEWSLACVSLLAASEILKSENHKLVVHEQLPEKDVRRAIEQYRKH